MNKRANCYEWIIGHYVLMLSRWWTWPMVTVERRDYEQE